MTRDRAGRSSSIRAAALVVGAVVAAVAPVPPAVIESWYSTGLYPRVQRLLTPASNLAPFAVLDVVCVAGIVWLVRIWWRALRPDPAPRLRRAGRALATTLAATAAVYLVFLGMWGLNYRRVELPERIVLDRAPPSTAEVAQLGRDVANRLNGQYPLAHNAGWLRPPWRNQPLRDAFHAVQRRLGDGPAATPGRLKRSLLGWFFRWTAVDAMVNPFGLEVLANPDLLPFELPVVAAHEWAHLAGYADESEASFVGWLACVGADVPSQYSGWLSLFWQIAGELPAAERNAVMSTLTAGPRDDLSAVAARLRRGDLPVLRRASWAVYDTYLRANRVEGGVRSYGAVVTLILRARFEDGWRPVLRVSNPP